MSDATKGVMAHYSEAGFAERVEQALRAAGKDPDHLEPAELESFDQFHTGGRDATLALARMADIKPGAKVIDLGGGIGGPARTLASEFGADVTVVDLSPAFCAVGARLTAATGLTDRVRFHEGSALSVPFPDGSFDLVWTQHSTMNIEDKEGLYREARRLLKPGGRFAMHEIIAGPNQPIHFPVPWAGDQSISFLRPVAEIRSLLADAGFREQQWVDMTEAAKEFTRQRAAAASATQPGALGLPVILGRDAADKLSNAGRNLSEDRIATVMAVFEAV
ncbi:MAG: methyltransferase domain-containing protein [Dehalococcoidia bacterium]